VAYSDEELIEKHMKIFSRAWTAPKAGNAPEQNEDAYRVQRVGGDDAGVLLVAISDGATEAVYSRLWAQTLVEAAAAAWPALGDEEIRARMQELGRSFSPAGLDGQTPWFVRNKFLTQGSQATLLVATIEKPAGVDAYRLRAVSIGDCCLVIFRRRGERLSFPINTSDEFGVNPVLVRTRSQDGLRCERFEAEIREGDVLVVASDALSRWILQCLESNNEGWVFEALFNLLAQQPPGRSVEDVVSDARERDEEVEPPGGGAAEGGDSHSWFRRLVEWIWPARAARAQPPPGDNHLESPRLPRELDLPVDFQQFIERWRAADSLLRMRNDDCTLILCVPTAGGDDESEVRERLLKYYSAALKREPA
jgi:hypothetical protein